MAEIITSEIEIQSGVISSGLTVDTGGIVSVLSGGAVTESEAVNYGYFWVEEGGHISNIHLTHSGDAIVVGGSADKLTVESGGMADIMEGTLRTGTIRNKGYGMIYMDGSGFDVTVSSGGNYLIDGGYGENTTVSSGGSFVVQQSGGLASRTTITNGGSARVVSGGEMYQVALNGGNLQVLSGHIYHTEINSGGSLFVDAAGEAHHTVLKDGGILDVFSGTIYDATVAGGRAELNKAALFRLDVNGGTVHAGSGTVITDGNLNAGGILHADSGAVIIGDAFNGGEFTAQAGAIVSRGIVSRTGLQTFSGVVYSDTQVYGTGALTVDSGAIIAGTTVSDSGKVFVQNEGVVAGTTVGMLGEVTLTGGTADGILINGSNTKISSDTTYIIGSSSYNTSSNEFPVLDPNGGLLRVLSGGFARDVALNCGSVYVSDGVISGLNTYTSDAWNNGGGQIDIDSGGIVRGATVYGKGWQAVILNTFVQPTPTLAYINVSAGGLLEDAEIRAARITVNSGGIVRNLFATYYSLVTVQNGGTLTGQQEFVSGTTVMAEAGGIIDFDLTSAGPGTHALMSGLNAVTGAPTYTLTVNADQTEGRYRLAADSYGFSATLTVRNSALETLGTLAMGMLTQIGDRYYLLNSKNDDLYLSVWADPPAHTDDPVIAYVNPEWAGLPTGETVEIAGGGVATIGYDAFASGDIAAISVAADGTVVVTGGEVAFHEPVIGCRVDVWAGATITGCTVGAHGGLTLRNGASGHDIAVVSGDFLLEAGAVLTGTNSLGGSGSLSVNGTILFDISGSTPEDYAPSFSVKSTLSGSPAYTLVVGDDQAAGAYTLVLEGGGMGSASVYNSYVISIVNKAGDYLGTVSRVLVPNGKGGNDIVTTDAVINGYRYLLEHKYNQFNADEINLTIQWDSENPYYIYVNSSWNSMKAGDQVYARNPDTGMYEFVTIGVEAFTTYEEASTKGYEGGKIIIEGGTYSPAGGIGRNVVLYAGRLENTTVYRSLTIGGNGRAKGLTVVSGATLTVESFASTSTGEVNGTLYGGCVFEEGSDVTIDGALDFDLTGLNPGGNAPLYDGLRYVKGAPKGTITVNQDQAFGVYVLAVNAEGFSAGFTISVIQPQNNNPSVINIEDIGTIVAGGDSSILFSGSGNPVSVHDEADAASGVVDLPTIADPDSFAIGTTYRRAGVAYTLTEENGVLYLSVSAYEMPDAVYVSTAWTDKEYGETVTLQNGGIATIGVEAFASYKRGCMTVAETGTVYLEGGSYSNLESSNGGFNRNTVALNGTVIPGRLGGRIQPTFLTLASGAVGETLEIGGNCFITVNAGGILSGDTVVTDGVVVLKQGAVLNGTLTVKQYDNKQKGMVVLDGVSSFGGPVVIATGGTLSGAAVFTEDTDITLDGWLNFDISGSTGGGDALFSGLGYLKGESNYCITVGAQEDGIYRLADDAVGFSGSIVVKNVSGAEIGSLEIGKTIQIAGSYYTLRGLPSDGGYYLYLVVGERGVPENVYVNSAWEGKQFGEVVPIPGGTATMLYDAFADADEAAAAIPTGGTISIVGGAAYFKENKILTHTVVVNGGSLTLDTAGGRLAGDVIVNYSGRLSVARNILTPASITVNESGTLTGSFVFRSGMNVTINGTLDFDVSGKAAGEETALFEGFSFVQSRHAIFSVTVGKGQEEGAYRLLLDAADYTGKTVRLTDAGKEIGTLTVGDGNTVMYDNHFYSLKSVQDETGMYVLELNVERAPISLYVDSGWAGKKDGETVSVLISPGEWLTLTIGVEAFADADSAMAAAIPEDSLVIQGGTHTVSSGITINTEVRGGAAVHDCGVYANLTLKSNSSASNLVVSAGRTLLAESGAKLTGRCVFEEGSFILLDGNSMLDFDLSCTSVGGPALFEGFSHATTAKYTLTVSWLEEEGDYVLATDVKEFKSAITVTSAYGSHGAVALGRILMSSGKVYTLSLENQTLSLNIAKYVPPSEVYLDAAWADLPDGTVVKVSGGTAILGYNAFTNADAAMSTAGAEGTVMITGGTFAFSAGITADVIALKGSAVHDAVVQNTLTVKSGASARNLHVAAGGTLTVEAGATLTAWAVFDEGANITVDGTFDFDISEATAGSGVFVSGLDRVQGAPDYVLTISDIQGEGKYVLVSDAAGFDGVFTVRNTLGTQLGTLSAGQSIHVGNDIYELVLDESGDLCFAVSRPDGAQIAHVNTDWTGLPQGSTVSLPGGSSATLGWDAFPNASAFVCVAKGGTVVFWDRTLSVSDMGRADNVIVRGGGFNLNSQLGDGQTITVEAGAYVWNLQVAAGGTLTVEAGAKLTGWVVFFAEGANITVDGTLDFDISDMAAGSPFALYNDLRRVQGDTSYTITVSDRQAEGFYYLAFGAGGFKSAITLTATDGTALGTLRAGMSARVGDALYTLNLRNGSILNLSVTRVREKARSDIDGNGVSDVLFQYTGGDNQTGYWMNGKDTWRSSNAPHPAEWTLLGAYDMDGDGIADSVFVGNTVVDGVKGAYIGYYKSGVDTDDNWVNIHFLENEEENVWANKIGNLTGNPDKNSIVWHCAGLGALGVWTDGTSEWTSLGAGFDSNWTMVGCGDFDGDGRDSVVMSYMGGVKYYVIGLDGSAVDMGSLNWGGWEVRAIGDFAGDSKDDMVLFHKETGVMVMLADGCVDSYTVLGQLAADDWFVVGAGDYDGDSKDDLLVRQYSTGMLGYYSSGDTSKWTELGRGVDMDWTVIA